MFVRNLRVQITCEQVRARVLHTMWHIHAHTHAHVRSTAGRKEGESSSHSPFGPISQFLSPLSSVASVVDVASRDTRRTSSDDNAQRLLSLDSPLSSLAFSLITRFSALVVSPNACRQAGPRGTAPGRGPYALLHGTLTHIIMALRRRHLCARIRLSTIHDDYEPTIPCAPLCTADGKMRPRAPGQ